MKLSVHNGDDLTRLIAYVTQHPFPFRCAVTAGEDRSEDQNSLSHVWYQDIGRQLDGWTASDARAHCKLNIGIKRILYSENDEFREQWNRLIRGRFDYEELLDLMLPPHDYPVTRIMTTKQMTQFMDEVHREFSMQGVTLTKPAWSA